MSESKEITLRPSDVQSYTASFGLIPGDPVFEGLVTVFKYGQAYESGDVEGAKKIAYERQADISALWRRVKEYEAATKQIKPLIEKICTDVPMPDYFKWQQGAIKKTKTVTNMVELWKRLQAQGVSLDAFLSKCTIDFKDAMEMSGFNETKFVEEFAGDCIEIETKQNKNTLKAIV